MSNMKRSNNHIHKYERVKLGENYIVFKCSLPGCTHYVNKSLAKGRLCLCNRCGNAMILTQASMKLRKPHCEDCINRKSEVHDKLKELIGAKRI